MGGLFLCVLDAKVYAGKCREGYTSIQEETLSIKNEKGELM